MSPSEPTRLEVLRRHVESGPDDPRAWYFLAHEHFRAEQWAEAERCYRRYLVLEPHDEGVGWRNLATAVARSGRIDEALDLYRRGVEAARAHDHEDLAGEIEELIDDL